MIFCIFCIPWITQVFSRIVFAYLFICLWMIFSFIFAPFFKCLPVAVIQFHSRTKIWLGNMCHQGWWPEVLHFMIFVGNLIISLQDSSKFLCYFHQPSVSHVTGYSFISFLPEFFCDISSVFIFFDFVDLWPCGSLTLIYQRYLRRCGMN